MRFHQRPFHERMAIMGDISESAFMQWASTRDINYVEYGLNRPPFTNFPKLPKKIRATPDFLCEQYNKHFFVECKGINGQYLKFKKNVIVGLDLWPELPIWIFVYDSGRHRAVFLPYEDVVALTQGVKEQEFHDGNKYYPINIKKLDPWEDFDYETSD